jgi:hypothetical protein
VGLALALWLVFVLWFVGYEEELVNSGGLE